MAAMERVFSGIQPTGGVHIGNYLGAIRNYVKLGESYGSRAIYCIVDYHAMTIPYETALLGRRTFEVALVNMAAGLDTDKVALFVQSSVPEHTELAWVLTTQMPVGDLSRMTQYKDKAQKYESVKAGLLMYPVLMAADILLYKAGLVPVGDDQLQHLELSREIARRFNARFGDTFPEPRALVDENAPRVPGIDGKTKMSKSVGNTIELLEPPVKTWEKLRVAPTDPARVRRSDPGEPTRCLIYTYHGYFSRPELVAAVGSECRSAGIGCVDCKKLLFSEMQRSLAPVRERAEALRTNPDQVRDALEDGRRKASKLAGETMGEVREKIGLYLPAGGPG